jgi:conjugative relaxase-like TrwC/TraI family protein
MLTIHKISNVAYYSDLAKEDYYLDGGEPNGIWAGSAARLLGLSGIVNTQEYKNVMHGYTPDKKYSLCQKKGTKHRYGYDLTFSVPKSVSVAWARSDQAMKRKIQEANKKGVDAALKLIEQHAAITRRGHGGKIKEKVSGLVACVFEHATSRAQDPQLHNHCLVVNAAPRDDGTWGTLDSQYFYFWKMAAGATYRAEMAYHLHKLGFHIGQDGSAFKLTGIPETICEYYSKRAEAIKEELAKRGHVSSSSKVGDIVALNTREKKTDISRSKLYQTWFAELDTLGYTAAQQTTLLNNQPKKYLSWLYSNEPDNPQLTLGTIDKKLTEKLAVFRLQDIYRTAAEISQVSGENASSSQKVAEEFIEQKSTISLGLDNNRNAIFTTQGVLDNEQEMITGAKHLRNQNKFMIDNHVINRAISAKSFTLSEEQQEAVFSACQNNAFDIIQGSAGAGKSALMDCVGNAYKHAGYKVIGCAIAKSAANNLAEEANIETFTIAKLLKDKALAENSVLIVDEAGQVSTKDLRKLIDLVKKKNSKLILVGEDKQLDAIEHGGALKYLSQPAILGTSRVETIMRQREEWARQAVADFRDGKAEQALKVLNEKGLLNFGDDAEQTKNLLIEKWNNYRIINPDKKSLLLAQRWQDVTELNEQVRSILQVEGRIDNKELSIQCYVSGKTFTNKFAIGERIRLTKNDYSKSLSNGDLGNIVDIQTEIDGSHNFKVKLDNGNKLTINIDEYCNDDGDLYMTQAYAMTVYASQGLTIDGDVFVYYTTGMDRANTYVACSRQKDNSHLFVNTLELTKYKNDGFKAFTHNLAKNMSQNKQSRLAVEYREYGHIGYGMEI